MRYPRIHILKQQKIDLSAVVLGYILGPLAERGMVRTMIMEGGLGGAIAPSLQDRSVSS